MQRLRVDGPHGRELGQRHVGADDVGRQLGLGGEAQAQRAQGLEQRPVGLGDGDGALALPLGFGARLLGRDAHEKALLAAQDGPRGVGEQQRAVAVVVAGEMPGRSELAEDTLPRRLVGILADTEHRQLVVAGARNALVRAPHQHVDEVGGAKTLAGAINRRQRLLRQHRAVHRLRRG